MRYVVVSLAGAAGSGADEVEALEALAVLKTNLPTPTLQPMFSEAPA